MNLMKYRSVKYVGATLICVAGLLTATFAIAGKRSSGHSDDPEFKFVKCDIHGGKIEVWGEVKGHSRGAKVVLLAEGKAETECYNPAGHEVEAQGDKQRFDIKKVAKVEDKEFDIHARINTDAKCEGKENWKARTKLEFEDDEFTVKLIDKQGDVVDVWECTVEDHDCECEPANSGGWHH